MSVSEVSRSTSSSCPAPDQPGEGVLLHYSSDNGITWTLLQHYAYQGFHEPRYTVLNTHTTAGLYCGHVEQHGIFSSALCQAHKLIYAV